LDDRTESAEARANAGLGERGAELAAAIVHRDWVLANMAPLRTDESLRGVRAAAARGRVRLADHLASRGDLAGAAQAYSAAGELLVQATEHLGAVREFRAAGDQHLRAGDVAGARQAFGRAAQVRNLAAMLDETVDGDTAYQQAIDDNTELLRHLRSVPDGEPAALDLPAHIDAMHGALSRRRQPSASPR
jgi:hypothetical protein